MPAHVDQGILGVVEFNFYPLVFPLFGIFAPAFQPAGPFGLDLAYQVQILFRLRV